jgi:hypothetical protein
MSDRLSTSKGDHDPIAETRSERVTPSGVLSESDLAG